MQPGGPTAGVETVPGIDRLQPGEACLPAKIGLQSLLCPVTSMMDRDLRTVPYGEKEKKTGKNP
jgi:hypothetical protein